MSVKNYENQQLFLLQSVLYLIDENVSYLANVSSIFVAVR